MLRFRNISLSLAFAALSVFAVQAAENPLAVFPKETGVIVRLKSPKTTLETVGNLAKKVDEKAGQQAKFGMPALGMMISNPTLDGVDREGDWWLAVFPVENGDPGVVFCIPTTDADAMKSAITGDYQFQSFEKWGIYTEHKDTATKIKQQIVKKGESISTLMDRKSTSIWEEGNLSIFINVPHLLKVYRGAFAQGVKQVEDVIEQMPAMIPSQQSGVDGKAIAEMYSTLFQTLVQSVKDAEGCVAALSISGEGVSLNEYARFSQGSPSSKHLQKFTTDELDQLGQLPAGQLVYGASKMDVGQFMQWAMSYSMQMVAHDDTEKEKKFKKLIAEYEKLDFGSMAMAFGLKNTKKGAMRGFSIIEVKNPKALQKLSQKGAELVSSYDFGGIKAKTTYEPNAETYGDLKADLTRVKYEYDNQANPFQVQMQTMVNDTLYGPYGMVTRAFYLKDRTAQAVGGDKKSAEALLSALDGRNNIGKHPAFQATRSKLLSKANLIGMVDLPSLIASGMELALTVEVAPAGAIPFNENDINAIRGKSTFLGTSIAVEGDGVHAKTVVPVQQMQGVARFVRLIQKIEQEQRNADPAF